MICSSLCADEAEVVYYGFSLCKAHLDWWYCEERNNPNLTPKEIFELIWKEERDEIIYYMQGDEENV